MTSRHQKGMEPKAVTQIIMGADVLRFVLIPKTVTLVKVPGVTLGIKLKKNPSGAGPAIKGVDAGSMADGKIAAGDVVRSINGVVVLKSAMTQVMELIKSSDTLVFVFEPPADEGDFDMLAGLLGAQ